MELKPVFVRAKSQADFTRKIKGNGSVYYILESGELLPEIIYTAMMSEGRPSILDQVTLPVGYRKPENEIFSDLRRTLGAKGYKLKFVKSEPDPITGEA